jgi:hypothetical protein
MSKMPTSATCRPGPPLPAAPAAVEGLRRTRSGQEQDGQYVRTGALSQLEHFLTGQQNHPGSSVAHDPLAGRKVETRSCAYWHPGGTRRASHLPLAVSPWMWPDEWGDARNAGSSVPLFRARSRHPLMTWKERAGVEENRQQRVHAGGPALPTPQQGDLPAQARQLQGLAPGQQELPAARPESGTVGQGQVPETLHQRAGERQLTETRRVACRKRVFSAASEQIRRLPYPASNRE